MMLSYLFQDWIRGQNNIKSRLICLGFRFAHWCSSWRYRNNFIWVLCVPYLVLYRLFVEWTLGVEIPQKTKIGGGLRIEHGFGLVVNDQAVIGNNVTLRHGTTIGNKGGGDKRCPVIGDRVNIGCSVVIIGGINIGDDVIIGAGSVVLGDVPSGSVVAGNPARILKSEKM